jgi:hypothetical protein
MRSNIAPIQLFTTEFCCQHQTRDDRRAGGPESPANRYVRVEYQSAAWLNLQMTHRFYDQIVILVCQASQGASAFDLERRIGSIQRRRQITIECEANAIKAGTQIRCAAWHPYANGCHQTSSSTCPTWSAGFTRGRIFAMLPRSSMMNEVRSTPMVFLPYKFFSFQTS